MQKIPTIKELTEITGKKILVRTDFNVPLHNGQVTDPTQITGMRYAKKIGRSKS